MQQTPTTPESPIDPDTGTPDAVVIDAARRTIDAFAREWSAQNLRGVADLWDPETQDVTYVAEELAVVLADRTSVVDHLLRTEHRIAASEVSVRDVAIHRLDADLVLATFVCRWDLEWTSYSRISVVLRRRGKQFFFVHYMESPFHMQEANR